MTHIGSDANETYRSDLFTNQLRSFDELLVGRCFVQSIRKAIYSQLADCSTDAQGFDSIGPEELITKERLDDRGDSSCMMMSHTLSH